MADHEQNDELDPPSVSQRDAALAKITASIEGVEAARGELDRAVADARQAGVTWTDIGACLGVSRQAAWERFNKTSDPDAP